jgi:hypothetical protein
MAATCGARRVSWSEIQGKLNGVLSRDLLSAISDLISRAKQTDLFTAKYDYGKLIVDRGAFKSPCLPEYCSTCRALQKALHQENAYTPIPLSAILDGCVEVFVEYPQEDGLPRHAPLSLMRKPELFGVFEALDRLLETPTARPPWSVSSGARSVWIIAPTGDVRLPKALGKFLNVNIPWNSELHPHWKLIESVVRQRHVWSTEVLLFPKSLGEHIRSATTLFNALLQIGWKQSSGLRHMATDDADLREAVHRAMNTYNLPQGELFQYVTIRHFLEMIQGQATAFRSSDVDTSEAGPFSIFNKYLQSALESMHLNYRPIVMQPAQLVKEGDVGYYSLRCPSIPGPRPTRVRDSLAQIAGSYRDVIQEIGGDRTKILAEPNLAFFVRTAVDTRKPSDGKTLPTGVTSTENLPLSDFYPGQKISRKDSIFLSSPFLLAVARVVRTSRPESVLQVNHRQLRSGVSGAA